MHKNTLSLEKQQIRIEELKTRNIELLSLFTRTKDKHLFGCLVKDCGHKWESIIGNVFRGSGCPKCAGQYLEPTELQYRTDRLEKRNIRMLTHYKGVNKKHDFLCLLDNCNHKWTAIYQSVNNGKGCPKCSGRYIDEAEIDRRNNKLLTRNIKILESYKGADKKHRFLCMVEHCNHEWAAVIYNVWFGSGCPRCGKVFLTAEDRLRSKAHKRLRSRFNDMFRKGVTTIKIHKDNDIYNEIFSHWAEQYKLLPLKPETEEEWELDHIIPISWFNPYNIAEMKLCWSAENFQWLTKNENSAKRDRIRPQDLAALTDWHYDVISKCSYPKPHPVKSTYC